MIESELNTLRDRAYRIACDHGFHDNKELSDDHWMCLVVSELMEAVEADRKGKHADVKGFNSAIEWHKKAQDKMLSPDEFYQNCFKEYIKDSVEDELADAAIRLLDLAGLRKIYLPELNEEGINSFTSYFSGKTFTECVFRIATFTTDFPRITHRVKCTLTPIFAFAKHLNIDLLWFINHKMNYNERREPMHGKKY